MARCGEMTDEARIGVRGHGKAKWVVPVLAMLVAAFWGAVTGLVYGATVRDPVAKAWIAVGVTWGVAVASAAGFRSGVVWCRWMRSRIQDPEGHMARSLAMGTLWGAAAGALVTLVLHLCMIPLALIRAPQAFIFLLPFGLVLGTSSGVILGFFSAMVWRLCCNQRLVGKERSKCPEE
jgi:hypothetical protein